MTRQTIKADNVISEDSGNESSNPNNRTSSSDSTLDESTEEPSSKILKEGEQLSAIPFSSECVLVNKK